MDSKRNDKESNAVAKTEPYEGQSNDGQLYEVQPYDINTDGYDRKGYYERENLLLRTLIEKIQSENEHLLYEITLMREKVSKNLTVLSHWDQI